MPLTELQKFGTVVLSHFRRMHDIYSNPVPMTVTIPRGSIDENGNLVDVALDNMSKVKAGFVTNYLTGTQGGDYATLPVKFFTDNRTIKNIHIKTDIPKQSTRMCGIKIEGYAFDIAKSINTICSAYNYKIENAIINKDTINDDKITSDFYWSSDEFLCLRLTSVGSFYYTTLRVTPIIIGNSGVYSVTAIINQEGDL